MVVAVSATTLVSFVDAVVLGAGWLFTAGLVVRLRCRLHTDGLTGLANRDGLIQVFKRACRSHAAAVGVLLLDLDKFKQINDQHGHAAGNIVLRHVAAQLGAVIKRGELAVRLHGDEYVVLLGRLPIGQAGMQAADERAATVAAAVACPVVIDGALVRVSASVGVAVCARAHADLSGLLRAADQRMYARKRATAATGHAVGADGGGR